MADNPLVCSQAPFRSPSGRSISNPARNQHVRPVHGHADPSRTGDEQLQTHAPPLMVSRGPPQKSMALLERTITAATTESVSSHGAPQSESRAPEYVERVDEEEDDAAYEVDELADAKPKKKRKVIQTGDKKYQCPQPDCGKAYSRAEHLYRHQLNHTPKQIYRCDFPGCQRHFVRADLCARHRERHTAKGSHLQRKDAFFNSQRPTNEVSGPPSPPSGIATVDNVSTQTGHAVTGNTYTERPLPQQPSDNVASYPPQPQGAGDYAQAQQPNGMPVDPQLPNGGDYSAYAGPVNGLPHQQSFASPPSPTSARRYSYDSGFARPAPSIQTSSHGSQHHINNFNSMPPPLSSPPTAPSMYSQQTYVSPSTTSQQLRSPRSYSTLPSLPPFGYPTAYIPGTNRSGSILSPPTITSSDQIPMPNSRTNSLADFNAIDQMVSGYAMPVFGGDGFNRSPPSVYDDSFLSSLFTPIGLDLVNPSPPGPEPMCNPNVLNIPLPKLEPNGTPVEPSVPATESRPVEPSTNGLNINIPESAIDEEKKQRLAALVTSWQDIEQNEGRRSKGIILMGDSGDPYHVMSTHMLKTYLTSYWVHVHQQMPILHRPTFNPKTCPDLLLLAMMCLGATCLERTHDPEVTTNSAELSFFTAYHIRWEVFKDPEFRPPAKLWTFQTLLLLELFEKMFSTKSLHERAHIHHATTLTVMRRGSSLIGRSATEVAAAGDDPTRTPPGPDGSINTSGQNTPDAFWNRWITAEATRRVAFAAFIIDSTHATLFGHSAVMSPHDLRLPLPCDEALWSATSSAEVQRVEASLAANGFKPSSFLEGLKRTLNGQRIRTNTFGRVVRLTCRDTDASTRG